MECGSTRQGACTTHKAKVECEHAVVLGEDRWCDKDVKGVRNLVVHVEEVQGSGLMLANEDP